MSMKHPDFPSIRLPGAVLVTVVTSLSNTQSLLSWGLQSRKEDRQSNQNQQLLQYSIKTDASEAAQELCAHTALHRELTQP